MWRRPSGHRRISTVNPKTTTALTTLNPLTSKNKLNVTRWAYLVCEKSVEIREICGRQLSAQCAKEQSGCFYSPTDLSDKHRYHAGCLYQKTRIAPMRTDGSFHGFFTLAPLPTAWGLMRRRRNGSPRIFSHAESCMGECHTMGLLDMRKICGNPRDLWATTKRTMR